MILVISKTKFDSSFPLGQFLVCFLDRSPNGGDTILFVREVLFPTLLNPQLFINELFAKINLTE